MAINWFLQNFNFGTFAFDSHAFIGVMKGRFIFNYVDAHCGYGGTSFFVCFISPLP